MKYRPEIDGLRALAVLPVILFHARIQTFSGGFVGVDVFFVISGYLITSIILSDLEKGRFSIVNFYERRARRILPALFLVVACCLPAAWFWLWPNDMKAFSETSPRSPCSRQFPVLASGGYFDTAENQAAVARLGLAVEGSFMCCSHPAFSRLALCREMAGSGDHRGRSGGFPLADWAQQHGLPPHSSCCRHGRGNCRSGRWWLSLAKTEEAMGAAPSSCRQQGSRSLPLPFSHLTRERRFRAGMRCCRPAARH
jgi:hypothetical protein